MDKDVDPIEVANDKSLDDFMKEYLPSNKDWTIWTHPTTSSTYSITLQTAASLSTPDFKACFNLISTTSSADYKKSPDGWKPRSKQKEMKLLDLKYLIVKSSNVEEGVQGFASIMPTYEDLYPVLYIYEIHLCSALQGTGLANTLMKLILDIAHKIPSTQKVMLTCFTCNERAVRFYEKAGFAKDEFSPLPKMLRNGSKKEVDYVILSKAVD
ncbi:N-alpha-acetyltransferase [Lachnellula hyalina]|uniref:N-alpha-acetyltransferase 40 n=1 Tax=Lachnellula hyalina TaxID=1316788 RepID=A0A8H8R3Q4_9HELO|nr:N-alpha-acetyltransferase [Lachnellula hyalina]TVY27992.1 N-alpha-acetyltransferase [Lachnellula hyalina]